VSGRWVTDTGNGTVADLLATWDSWSNDELTRRDPRWGARDSDPAGPLDALKAATALCRTLERWRVAAIRDARAQGKSWEAIGAAMGVTPHAAQDAADPLGVFSHGATTHGWEQDERTA